MWLCPVAKPPYVITMLGRGVLGHAPLELFKIYRHKMVHSGGRWGKINLSFYLQFCHLFKVFQNCYLSTYFCFQNMMLTNAIYTVVSVGHSFQYV